MSHASPTFAMMVSKLYFHFIAFAFLILLIGVNGLDYHTLTHDEADETHQCELCASMVCLELQEYNVPSQCEIPPKKAEIIEGQNILVVIPAYPDKTSSKSSFSRPPPVWV